MNRSPHEILHPDQQKRLDKNAISTLLQNHNLVENVDLIYRILLDYAANSDQEIDRCLAKILKEFHSKDTK